jgi:hypothetical protein
MSILDIIRGLNKSKVGLSGSPDTGLAQVTSSDVELAAKEGQAKLGQAQEQVKAADADLKLKQQEADAAFSDQKWEAEFKEIQRKDRMESALSQTLTEFKQRGQQLDLKNDNLQTERLGFLLRLSSDSYLDMIKREGTKDRLLNQVRFKEEAMKSVFADSMEAFESNLNFRRLMDMKDDQLKRELAEIDIDTALATVSALEASKTQAQQQQAINNVSGAVSSVFQSKAVMTSAEGWLKPSASPSQPDMPGGRLATETEMEN